MLLLSAVAGVPPLFGVSDREVVLVGALIAGVQAGQSAAVQVDLRPKRLIRVIGLVALVVGASSAVFGNGLPLFVGVLGVTAGAMPSGLVLGARSANTLKAGPLQYQRFLLARNVTFLIAVTAGSGFEQLGLTSDLPIAALSLFVAVATVLAWSSPAETLDSALLNGSSRVAILGALAALVYRNDVTLLRGAAEGSSTFELWHYSLLVYSSGQAVIGAVVVNLLFGERAKWRGIFYSLSRGQRFAAAGATVPVAAVAVVISLGTPLLLSLVLASAVGLLASVCSGFAHVAGRSKVPYAAGLAATCLLAILIWLDVPLETAFAAQVACLLVTIAILLFVFPKKELR